MLDRVIYAGLSAAFGALIGAACWWLYGLAHSIQYDGPGIDPAVLHWVKPFALAFGAIGLVLGEKAGDIVGHVAGAIFNFEADRDQAHMPHWIGLLVVSGLAVLLWFQFYG